MNKIFIVPIVSLLFLCSCGLYDMPTTTQETTESVSDVSEELSVEATESIYEYAFVDDHETSKKHGRTKKNKNGYSEYILLDMDTMTSRTFTTRYNYMGVSVGKIKGTINYGFTITYEYPDGQWTEELKMVSENEAELIEGKYQKLSFTKIEPYVAEKIMIEGDYHDKSSILDLEEGLESEYQTIKLGVYNDVPLEWLVLESNEDSALIVSKYTLGIIAFNQSTIAEATDWEHCTYRSWLNQKFYPESFSKEEQNHIITATVEDYSDYDGGKPKTTKDKVFILNFDQITTHFPGLSYRAIYCPMFLKAHDRKFGATPYCSWWVLGGDRLYKTAIRDSGEIGQPRVNEDEGIRPAMLIDTNYANQLIQPVE